jgi:membrane associated rhomboid family serine protease
MGLYDRDYIRERTPSGWGFEGVPVVKYLIAVNVVVFLLQILIVRPPQIPEREVAAPRAADEDRPPTEQDVYDAMRAMQRVSVVQEWFELDTDKVVQKGQLWRLLTHAFCHDRTSVFHILLNMIALYWFGRTLELMYGSREFLLFYLTAALLAALASVALDLQTGSHIPAVGASGAVLAVLMLYTMHFPCETICVCWFFPLEMRWLMVLFVIWDLHPVLLALAGDRLFTGVGHAAHLGGLAFGFLYARYGWRLEGIGERIPWIGWRPSRRFRVCRPPGTGRAPTTDWDPGRVDEVLEKISKSGQDSLSEEERAILRAASERLKHRTPGG